MKLIHLLPVAGCVLIMQHFGQKNNVAVRYSGRVEKTVKEIRGK